MRWVERILWSLLTFVLVFAICCGGEKTSDSERLNNVSEIVFISELSRRPLGSQQGDYFLYVLENKDPADLLLDRLRSKHFQVKPASQSKIINGRVEDKDTGSWGTLLGVNKIECKDRNECEVEAKIYTDTDNEEIWVYHVVKKNNIWTIKEKKLTSIV